MKKLLLLSAMAMGLAFASCETDGDTPVQYQDAAVNVGNTYQIPNSENCDWKSGLPTVASVEGDIVTANHVGTAKIWCSQGNFVVTVNPNVTLYVEPKLTWGADITKFKDQFKEADGYKLASSADDQLVYGANTQIADQLNTSCTYNFAKIINEKGKEIYGLVEVVETLQPTVTDETILKALNERYLPNGENAWKSIDGTFTIALAAANGTHTVTYRPAE